MHRCPGSFWIHGPYQSTKVQKFVQATHVLVTSLVSDRVAAIAFLRRYLQGLMNV